MRDLTTTNNTGTTSRVKNMEQISPTAMTLASGLHKLDPERIIGSTPTAAAIVVRKMGRRRRSPASVCGQLKRVPFAHFLINIVDENDCVSDHDTAQADKSHEGRKPERVACDYKPEDGAGKRERNR